MSDLELYKQALIVMVACFLTVGGALVWLVTWNARRVIASVDELKEAQGQKMDDLSKTLQMEMRAFDRRLTRVETMARVRSDDVERDIDEARRAN